MSILLYSLLFENYFHSVFNINNCIDLASDHEIAIIFKKQQTIRNFLDYSESHG